MSVILDALKRVQDENRRRDSGPETSSTEASTERPRREPTANALLRRLSEPETPSKEGDSARSISPVIWTSAALVVLVLVVAAGLAWFQPTFEGPAVNDGRPLLAQNGVGNPGSGEARTAATGAVQERFGGGSSGGGSQGGGSSAGQTPLGSDDPSDGTGSGGDDLFSDLSGGLDAAEAAATGAVASNQASGDSDDSMLKLEVEERPVPQPESQPSAETSPAGGNSFLDLRSAEPAQDGGNAPQREWVPPTPAPVEETIERRESETPARLVDPGVRAAFAEGVRRHKAGDLAAATEAYERALDSDPRNARVNANLGVLYESLGQFGKAESHLREAVQSEPENAAAHNNLGVVLYRQGKYDAALIEFNRTLQLDPRRLDAYVNKGLIYTRWGQLEDAERAFRQVLAIEPDHALAHYNLGLVYEEAGDYRAAIDAYYKFLDTGGMDHMEITAYLERHLQWLEQRQQESGESY